MEDRRPTNSHGHRVGRRERPPSHGPRRVCPQATASRRPSQPAIARCPLRVGLQATTAPFLAHQPRAIAGPFTARQALGRRRRPPRKSALGRQLRGLPRMSPPAAGASLSARRPCSGDSRNDPCASALGRQQRRPPHASPRAAAARSSGPHPSVSTRATAASSCARAGGPRATAACGPRVHPPPA